uniref:NTF2 domain-containing protein n=1 Tax=Globodera pallida TaxID=36090 RepID=A0A183BMA4_GLOPA
MVCRLLLALLVPFLLQLSWALKHERVPAGLRPAKAVNEQRAGELEHLATDTLLLASLLCATDVSEIANCDAFFPGGKGLGLDAIAKRLNDLLNDPNAKTLLVLDGVQMVETVKFFDRIKAINATEGTPTKARVTIPPPAGKDFGVNTILQTNLVDSRGRVLKGPCLGESS